MAYTAGVFYIDLVSGSDAARTALTGCVASNPSGTITRINKTAHGLVTGAVVDLTLFSAWLNGAWKITKVDNNNFDLDTAVWQTTADANGTVTPRGGSSWSDAWLTITSGATSTRVQSGDEVRVSKTEDPFSIGSATWTDASKTVTLATAQTLTIDNCETAWTSANSGTVTTSTTRKQGSNSVRVTRSGAVANTLYAYKALGSTVDFSAYDAITLWIQAYSTNAIIANNWVISLCSDTAGATAVDSFAVPASATTGQWYPVTLTRTGGGALGSSIQSIALYTGSVAPGNGQAIAIDNISACDADGLNLRTLISKDSSATFSMSEGWWGIQSIDGTAVLLDAATFTSATGGMGYSGTSATATTYARKTFSQGPASTSFSAIMTTIGGVSYSGGWDTSTSTKTGLTVIEGSNGSRSAFGCNQSVSISDFWCCRYSTPFAIIQEFVKIQNTGSSNSTRSFYNDNAGASTDRANFVTFQNSFFHSCQNNDTPNSIGIPISWTFLTCKLLSMTAPPVIASIPKDSRIIDCTFANNGSGTLITTAANSISSKNILNLIDCSISGSTTAINTTAASGSFIPLILKNCKINTSTEFTTIANYHNARIFSQQHDQTAYDYIWTDGGTMNTEATDRSGQTGNMWRLVLTNTTRTSNYPLDLPVGQFAVAANSLVTISAWMKKSHATNCNGRLRVRAYQLAGLTSDVTATLANNTNWQELTLTFTPTEAGVFEVEALAEYVAANANVYIDTISVSQA
jgi:hypothetical protein